MKWFNIRMFADGPGEERFHRAVFDREYLKRCIMRASFASTHMLAKPRGYDHGYINMGMGAIK